MAITSAAQRPLATGMGMALTVLLLGAYMPAQAGANRGASTQTTPNHLTLGVGIAVAPRYQGSDDYDGEPVPLVNAQYGRLFVRTGDGIGLNLITTSDITAGVGVKLMDGYDDDDVPAGIDELDRELGARVFVSSNLNGAVATLAATKAITGSDRGLLVDANLTYPMSISSRLTLKPGAGMTWASEDYMDSYFGVSSHESVASGLGRYQPTSGFKDVYFRVSASYRLTSSLRVLGSVGVTHLIGEAADSPLVEEETQPVSFVGLAYTF